MKEFNLELAKQGKPVCTRDGHKARILCFDKKDDEYPIIALVEIKGCEKDYSYTANGNWDSEYFEDKLDLMMASEPINVWVNLYETPQKVMCTDGRLFKDKAEAEEYGRKWKYPSYTYIGAVEINTEI